MPPQALAAPITGGAQVKERALSARRIDRRMLIGGLLVGAESGQTLPSVNPANGEVVG
jgi:hypothetical protein